MLMFAKERHPKEAVLMLRGKVSKESIVITDYLFPPFATTNSISASYPIHMLPIDFSIVGMGMRNHAGVAAKAFDVLAAAGINIEMISTSEIKVSIVMAAKFMELAVRELHSAFGLDQK